MTRKGELYSVCPICSGKGEVERTENGGDWRTCIVCGGQKYTPAGISGAQVEMLMQQRDEAVAKVAKLELELKRWTEYAISLNPYDGKEER